MLKLHTKSYTIIYKINIAYYSEIIEYLPIDYFTYDVA